MKKRETIIWRKNQKTFIILNVGKLTWIVYFFKILADNFGKLWLWFARHIFERRHNCSADYAGASSGLLQCVCYLHKNIISCLKFGRFFIFKDFLKFLFVINVNEMIKLHFVTKYANKKNYPSFRAAVLATKT